MRNLKRREAILEEFRWHGRLNFWLGATLGVLLGGAITMFFVS